MLKKIGLPAIVLAAMMFLVAPTPASARVQFGVAVGPGVPYPAYPYSYAYPYTYPNYYYPYGYAPGYVAPYLNFGWGGGWGHGHVGHGHFRR